MDPSDLVKLTALMDRTSGSPEVKIGLIDGPVVTKHPDLAGLDFSKIPGTKELAAAIIECINAGVHIINLSLALVKPSTKGEQSLEEALDQARRHRINRRTIQQAYGVEEAPRLQGALRALQAYPWRLAA